MIYRELITPRYAEEGDWYLRPTDSLGEWCDLFICIVRCVGDGWPANDWKYMGTVPKSAPIIWLV